MPPTPPTSEQTFVRRAFLSLTLLAGCNAIFGLERPVDVAQDSAVGGGGGSDGSVPDTKDGVPLIDAHLVDAPIDALACAAGFGTIGTQSSKYFISSTTTRTWSAAEADCEARNAHLVVIGSDAERIAIHNAQPDVSWIGMSDLVTTGTFLWLTDEDTGGYPPPTGTPPWAFDPSQSSGHCVAIGVNGTWGNIDCTLSREYICECDGYAADPARY